MVFQAPAAAAATPDTRPATQPETFESGHVAAMTLAVIDVEKDLDKGNDGLQKP